MKLKKIASLMLAGVMAVSMLAGCSNKGGASSEGQNDEPTGINAAAVIAALDKDTTKNVTFSADAGLQATADKLATSVESGLGNVKFDLKNLNKIDEDINSTSTYLAEVKTGSKDNSASTDMKAQTVTFVVNASKLIGANDSAIVKELAAGIDKAGVYTNGAGMSALPEEGKTYKDSNTSESYKFTFKYTAGVAVVGTTADNGQTTYYAVVSLTRTPTRVAVD